MSTIQETLCYACQERKAFRRGLCRPCRAAGKEPLPSRVGANQYQTVPSSSNPELPVEAQVAGDRQRIRTAGEIASLKLKYAQALKQNEMLEHSIDTLRILHDGGETVQIDPTFGSGTSEGTLFAVASDWHVEERVDPRTISNLNEYNLEIAEERAKKFWRGVLRLHNLLAQDIKIPTIMLPLLGDFITGNIHGEENAENNLLEPAHAITFARNLLVSGIDFTLNNTKADLLIRGHVGNHSRTTKTTRFATENGHSLEYLMYLHMADLYRNEKRVKFEIAEGYHSYLNVYGTDIRFHHGHALKFNGGQAGLFQPANRSIDQWNKARRVDLDVFGHFHQSKDGGNFISNGSLIGYNAYAMSIKADFEPPKQALFLIDKKRGRTCTWPLWFGGR